MNFKTDAKKQEMQVAREKLEFAAGLLSAAASITSKAHDALTAIPTKGRSSWFRGADRANAQADLLAAQQEQAMRQSARDKAEIAYNQASEVYLVAIHDQRIADESAAEADKAAREQMKNAMVRILPTQLIDTTGKKAVRRLETLKAREEKLRTDKASVNADLRAAEILGFSGTVAE